MKKELKVKVKFFSEECGGRQQLPEDLLSIGTYRPHFVVGDPEQKPVIVDKHNKSQECYLGIAFTSQEGALKAENEIEALVITVYPDVDYSELVSGSTFTIREGQKIVGNGKVI
jgi:hypothetical protein